MPIIIVLLATIVAFLFGGPILAIAALLIGLIVVFPNVVGVIAAGIGTIILLSVLLGTLSEKWDISPDSLISIIFLVIIGLMGLISLIVSIMENVENKKSKYQSLEKLKEEEKDYLDLIEIKQETSEKQNFVKSKTEKNTYDTKKEQVNITEKSSSNIDDLMKLSNLLKEGLITEDEYQREKSKLLNSK